MILFNSLTLFLMLVLKPKFLVAFCLLIFFLIVREIYILLIVQSSIYCHSKITQFIQILIALLLKQYLIGIKHTNVETQ